MAIGLIEEIKIYIDESPDIRAVPVHLQVMCALHFFASGSYQRVVGKDPFAFLSQTMVSRIVKKISEVITNNLSEKYVKLPLTEEEAIPIKSSFLSETGIPGILGIIDGTHVALVNISKDEEYIYVNRKGFHSINVQIICDNDLIILNCNARYPGSCHDSHVFESSLPLRIISNLNASNKINWLIGDNGYALKDYMVTPFKRPNNPQEEHFNMVHKKIRSKVERCIGVLKGRFRCLIKDRALHYSHKRAAYIIYAACVCHNILMQNKVPINENEIIVDEDDDAPINSNNTRSFGRSYLLQYVTQNNIQL